MYILDYPKVVSTRGYPKELRQMLLQLVLQERYRRVALKLAKLLKQKFGGKTEDKKRVKAEKGVKALLEATGHDVKDHRMPSPRRCIEMLPGHYIEWNMREESCHIWWGSKSDDHILPLDTPLDKAIMALGFALSKSDDRRRKIMFPSDGEEEEVDSPYGRRFEQRFEPEGKYMLTSAHEEPLLIEWQREYGVVVSKLIVATKNNKSKE